MKKFLSINDIKVIMGIFKELNTKENKMDGMEITYKTLKVHSMIVIT